MNDRGERYEALAHAHLRDAGLTPVARNFQTRFGELDLVMRDGDVLVFVEVRYRARAAYGGGAESITASKRQRLAVAAQQFLQAQPALARLPCRFDVVALSGDPAQPSVDWLRDAFDT